MGTHVSQAPDRHVAEATEAKLRQSRAKHGGDGVSYGARGSKKENPLGRRRR
jgi:hypothetical protein